MALMAAACFVTVSLAFGLAVVSYGGTEPLTWHVTLAALGVASGLYFVSARPAAPPPGRLLTLMLLGFAMVCVLPLVPLPAALVGALSPASARIHEAAVTVMGGAAWFPLTVSPVATFQYCLMMLGSLVLFLFVRDAGWRWRTRPWMVLLPPIAAGTLEAILGLVQVLSFGAAHAQGTYVNRNHYSGLLALCLAPAGTAAWFLLRRHAPLSSRRTHASGAIQAGLALTAATLIAAGIVLSLSRGGFLAAIGGGLAAGVAGGMGRSGRRWGPVAAAAGFAGILGLLLPSGALLDRFTAVAGAGDLSTATRVAIWRATLDLFRDFPLFGAGPGAFASVFHAYQTMAPLEAVDRAHNDYLQLLAELGIVGFALVAALAVRAATRAIQACGARRPEIRYVSVACVGAFAAAAVHSVSDFNLYIPANVLAVAWLAGVSEATADTSGCVRPPAPQRAGGCS